MRVYELLLTLVENLFPVTQNEEKIKMTSSPHFFNNLKLLKIYSHFLTVYKNKLVCIYFF